MRDLVISFSAASPKQGAEVMRTDGKYHHDSSSTITRGSRSIGAKGSKSLKRQHPSSSQRASSSKSEQIRENGGKPSESEQFNKEWLGDLAPKQLDRGTRRDNPSDQVNTDAGVGVVQGGDGSGMEEHFPIDNGEPQIGEAFAGSSGLGADAQSLVAIHNRYSVKIGRAHV